MNNGDNNREATMRGALKWTHIKDDGNKGSRWESTCGRFVAEWTTDEAYYKDLKPLWILSGWDKDTEYHETISSFSTLTECRAMAQRISGGNDE